MWEKNFCRTRQATDDNMAHGHCVLDNWGYRHALRICNIHCLPTAAVVTLTHLIVTLYVHCLSCYIAALFDWHKHAEVKLCKRFFFALPVFKIFLFEEWLRAQVCYCGDLSSILCTRRLQFNCSCSQLYNSSLLFPSASSFVIRLRLFPSAI